MEKTKQMINDFLEQVEKDKILAVEKLTQLNEQRVVLDRERSEISKAVIRFENEGDQEGVNKLSKELSKRVTEISVLDSKIEAYGEMGNSYEAEAEKVFACAAKEYNEDYPKLLEKEREKKSKASIAVEKAEKELQKCRDLYDSLDSNIRSIEHSAKNVIDYQMKEIEKYLPKELEDLESPKPTGHHEEKIEETYYSGIRVGNEKDLKNNPPIGHTLKRATQVYVEDSENYGDGMEGKLTYYYKQIMSHDPAAKKKTFIDTLLGR